MHNATTKCPLTGDEVVPVSAVPLGWMEDAPPVIVCPSCGGTHPPLSVQSLLVDVPGGRCDPPEA